VYPCGFLHNYQVEETVAGLHTVKRWSPADKKRLDVSTPAVTAEYAAHYSGVDHKDRDTADWTVSVRGTRFYMRIFFWVLDGVVHAMYCIIKYVAQDKDHPWHKYNLNNGRFNFQMDLAHALIAKGIEMDCPNHDDLKDPKKRPGYMRKMDWLPCACNRCFFCKEGLTHGISHKPKVGKRIHSTTVSPVGHTDVPIQMNERGTSQYCRVRYYKKKEEFPDLSSTERRKKCSHPRKGCPGCGPTFYVCKKCWPEFDHNPNRYIG
jgi:hypothetical protein